jgi:ATP-binding protein involved in chromosome partitioning
MKELTIAIPSNDGETVEEHFGHCRKFVMINTLDGKETSRASIDPPAHAPGVFPAFLAEQGANTIITGGMGGRAVSLFKERNIDVILGASGSISDMLKIFLDGDLESSGSICSHHEDDCH